MRIEYRVNAPVTPQELASVFARSDIRPELQALIGVPPPIFNAFRLELSLVTPTHPLRDMNVADCDISAHEELLGRIEPDPDPDGGEHQLLGWGDYIQHDPRVRWGRQEAHSSDMNWNDETGSPLWDALAEQTREWVLLLKIDSDTRLNWTWGDVGKLYFHIRKPDLAVLDFSRVRLELQSH